MNISVVAIIAALSVVCISFWYLWSNQQHLLQDLRQLKLALHQLQQPPASEFRFPVPSEENASSDANTLNRSAASPSLAVAQAVADAAKVAVHSSEENVLHRAGASHDDRALYSSTDPMEGTPHDSYSSDESYDDDDEEDSSDDDVESEPAAAAVQHPQTTHTPDTGTDLSDSHAADLPNAATVAGDAQGTSGDAIDDDAAAISASPASVLSVNDGTSTLPTCDSSLDAAAGVTAEGSTSAVDVTNLIAPALQVDDAKEDNCPPLPELATNAVVDAADAAKDVPTACDDPNDDQPPAAEPQAALDAAAAIPTTAPSLSDSHEEDFVENQGNPQMMSDQLKRKTVLELKKLCQSHSIGVTKLGGYKTKKELIAGIVDKFCCAK